MIYLKAMNWIKKFWIAFLALLPISATASLAVIGGIAGVVAIGGFSIYRNFVPLNMNDALSFFSSCWSCQMFSDIMDTMSRILPGAYDALGDMIFYVAIALTAIWFAWKLLNGFFNNKVEEPWSIASSFGTHLVKLMFIGALVLVPLPRILTNVFIEPIFNVGLTLNHIVAADDSFNSCVVATALADPAPTAESAQVGAFSPMLRHRLACELAGVHQMTGLGITVGWSVLNMAFDTEYMHKLMWNIPIFPNIPIFFAGLLILVLFFMALIPVPMYFLEVFITLSMDLIMLPLMFLGWLFPDWKIFPKGKTIQEIINDVVSGTLGIAMIGVFVTFAIMFLNAVFGGWAGASSLAAAISANDSKFLMDALLMHNDSLITIIMMGIFITMFMTMIPTLVKTLFNVQISDKFYETAKKNLNIAWESVRKYYDAMKK